MLEHVSPTQIHISAGPALPLLMHITEGTLGTLQKSAPYICRVQAGEVLRKEGRRWVAGLTQTGHLKF